MFKRSDENPILVPEIDNPWESEAAFNGCPAVDGGKVHFVYRAAAADHSSSVGYAESRDGIHFKNRRQLIKPEHEWERYGCEDPRITKIGKNFYICYTALSEFPFRAEGIKIALAVTQNFKTLKKYQVTPFNAKAMALFPEKIKGKFAAVLTADTDRPPSKISIALFDSLEQMTSEKYWNKWYSEVENHRLLLERTPNDHLEVGAPPVKTKDGWLLFYSHIQNYFSPPAVFGIEAVLLDLKNPEKIIARTEKPLLVPEAEYEKYGTVPNIAFPSGAFIKNKKVHLYYGAADTVCAVAIANLKDVMKELKEFKPKEPLMERFEGNPIIQPDSSHSWEEKATFNPGAIYADKKIHLLYRAMSNDNTSVLGYAASKDGTTLIEKLPEPVYTPREEFESKLVPGGNSGCEDPRLTKLGNSIYMTYTAFDGRNPPRVALSSILYDDFITQKWNWSKPILISPPGVDDKDSALFPKKINNKFAILHRLGDSIWLDYQENLEFNNKWLEGKILMHPEHNETKIGIAGTPMEIKEGWLLIYHGINKTNNAYFLGALLLDLNDPMKIIAKTREPILEVEKDYEKHGLVPNVVFSNGSVILNKKLIIYYGGADKVIGVASVSLNTLLKKLKKSKQ